MVVIKLGGSLAQAGTLLQCLDNIEQRYRNTSTVIVPGGGSFADQVRLAQQRWQFSDKIAHHMAILAMQQMALLFKGLKNEFTIVSSLMDIQKYSQNIMIWSPDIVELNNASIFASWDITSDSLSAWLAQQLSASELILIKSADIDPALSLSELASSHIVDRAFGLFTENAAFKITLIHAHQF
jgi:5-(aminomethyl)-3-furanmethanol phosphate kinase